MFTYHCVIAAMVMLCRRTGCLPKTVLLCLQQFCCSLPKPMLKCFSHVVFCDEPWHELCFRLCLCKDAENAF